MNNQQTTLKQWLVRAPILFATSAFLFTVLISILGGLFLPNTDWTFALIGISVLATTLLSAFFAIRTIRTKYMDRTGIVTIFNIKMLVLTLASIVSAIIMSNVFPIQMWLFGLLRSQVGLFIGFALTSLLVLVSLYIFGITIMGLWACFLRARTMGIPLWKIICSIPFGFDMLWLPGYFIPNKQDKKPSVITNTKWISKLTNWTFARPTNAILLYMILVIASGAISNMISVLLTISMLLIFSIWMMRTGHKAFEKNIGAAYATTAVIINIAMLAYITAAIYMM